MPPPIGSVTMGVGQTDARHVTLALDGQVAEGVGVEQHECGPFLVVPMNPLCATGLTPR
jgi:hypothetical protein